MMEPTLFDQTTAVTNEAIERAAAHADATWMEAAFAAVERCCHLRPAFTTDDVYLYLDAQASTHEPRAMGAVMRRAAAAGLCEATGDYRPSSRVEAHRNPKRVWRSLVF